MKIEKLTTGKDTYKEKFIELLLYCFKMCERADFEKDWEKANREDATEVIFGMIDNGELASSITLSKRAIYMNKQKVSMTGVGGVATDSTYRSGGVCSSLMKDCLRTMYDEGAVYSMLAPFSYAFYQKLGWKWCYIQEQHEMNIDNMAGFKNQGTITKEKDIPTEELKKYYEGQAKQINGMMARLLPDWNKRMNIDDRYTISYRNSKGIIEGYMIYKINNNQSLFEVVELMYSSKEAAWSIFNYIYSHSAQVTKVKFCIANQALILDLLKNPRQETKQISYMMGRIINVEKALKAYEYQKEGSYIIEVTDELIQENQGIFKVRVNSNIEVDSNEKTYNAAVSKLEMSDVVDLKIDIRELTQLLIGFRTLLEIEAIDDIVIYNRKCIDYFKGSRSKVGLYDFF
ncbi:MAG: GNAT family N-acetyltransferase [Cellulosilyticaceae bacterium]